LFRAAVQHPGLPEKKRLPKLRSPRLFPEGGRKYVSKEQGMGGQKLKLKICSVHWEILGSATLLKNPWSPKCQKLWPLTVAPTFAVVVARQRWTCSPEASQPAPSAPHLPFAKPVSCAEDSKWYSSFLPGLSRASFGLWRWRRFI